VTYLSVKQVADLAGRHEKTVGLALRAGELHGSQRSRNASWRVREDCAEAWIEGRQCPHKASNVTSLSRRSA
jgi:hypothetical protein